MQNPFTTTFSKIPETYISTEQEREIIENFSYERPSESVYKITGVRGSGKTVLLAKVEEEFKKDYRRKEGWYVFRLSPGRDMLNQLAAYMVEEKLMQVKALKASASGALWMVISSSGAWRQLSATDTLYIIMV